MHGRNTKYNITYWYPTYYNMPPFTMQKVAYQTLKGGKSECDLPPFTKPTLTRQITLTCPLPCICAPLHR
ncbi:unknown [Prevotella sp. CAG:1058]|nr:unknown [Prevotella sp. CAG:1058]